MKFVLPVLTDREKTACIVCCMTINRAPTICKGPVPSNIARMIDTLLNLSCQMRAPLELLCSSMLYRITVMIMTFPVGPYVLFHLGVPLLTVLILQGQAYGLRLSRVLYCSYFRFIRANQSVLILSSGHK